MAKSYKSKIALLELQLEEALQMLQLVAENKRTCLEVEEWLKINFAEVNTDKDTLENLLSSKNNE
jgi:hypothetical protein